MTRVLLVDDEPGIRDVGRRVLQQAGYEVTVCDGGESALAELKENPPDVLLTDLHMPGLDGFKLLHAVGKLTKAPKVILFSGYGGPHLLDVAKMLGAQVTLEKPFTSEELLDALRKVGA